MRRSSIRTDEENGIVSFTYSCGVLGGILFTPADELDYLNGRVFSLPEVWFADAFRAGRIAVPDNNTSRRRRK